MAAKQAHIESARLASNERPTEKRLFNGEMFIAALALGFEITLPINFQSQIVQFVCLEETKPGATVNRKSHSHDNEQVEK